MNNALTMVPSFNSFYHQNLTFVHKEKVLILNTRDIQLVSDTLKNNRYAQINFHLGSRQE